MIGHLIWDIVSYYVPKMCKNYARKRVKSLTNLSEEEQQKVLEDILRHIDMEESMIGKIIVAFGTISWDDQAVPSVDQTDDQRKS